MKKFLLGALLFIACLHQSYGQMEDSLLTAPYSSFLREILTGPDSLPPIIGGPQSILKTTYPHSTLKGQYLIRKGNQLYIFLEGTGKVYRSEPVQDSLIRFRRIDKTVNVNYNGGGLVYIYNGEIHVYGGYGFWKSNGTDKKFSEKDGEWDVVPLSDEVIAHYDPSPLAWHNAAAAQLIVPYQLLVNNGIGSPEYIAGKVIPKTYRLDLATKVWTELGETHPQSLQLLRNSVLRTRSSSGYYLLHDGSLYHIDLLRNKIFRMTDPSIVQSYGRLNSQYFRLGTANQIRLYDAAAGIRDSLYLDPDKFEALSFPVYVQKGDYTGLLIAAGAGMALLLLIGYRIRKKAAPVTQQIPADPVQTGKTVFTETEIRLIHLLQEKTRQQQTTNLSEINYVLGVKDKNIGLQKKVRSDVINSINQKYRQNSGAEGPLILSTRSLEDKRYFEYFLGDPDFDPEA